jgi:hypothetical protein
LNNNYQTPLFIIKKVKKNKNSIINKLWHINCRNIIDSSSKYT